MNRVEVKAKLEELEKADFYLQMKDHWSNADFTLHDQNLNQIKFYKNILNGMKDGVEEC